MTPRCTWLALLVVALAVSVTASGKCAFVTQRVQCKDLTCNTTSGECMPCTDDAQCYNGAYGCLAGRCKLRPLKDTFTYVTLFAPLVGFTVCAIAVLAGVGGGAILVPLFVAILDIPMADAVGLSQATICGQSILNVFLQFRRHHPLHSPPNPTRPNINFEYSSMLLPIALSGTLLGSMGNKVSPDWLRVVLLITIFTYVLFRLMRRILAQRARDQEAKLLAAQQNDSDDDSPANKASGKSPANYGSGNNDNDEVEQREEKPQYPIGWIAWTLFVFGSQFAISYVKQNVATCGSLGFYLTVGACVLMGALQTTCCRAYLSKLHDKILDGELEESVVPFKWNTLTTVVFPLIAVFAGFAASMLGIGGGLVFSSLLLEAGLVPEHASATGGLATLLVAVQSAADFVLVGELRYDYGLMMFGSGILSTIFGQFVLMKEIKKRGFTFLIVAALATIMGGSMIAVTIFGIVNTVNIEKNDGNLGFGDLCNG